MQQAHTKHCEPEKHYSLSALSRESGIRKSTLRTWIANGWLVGDKISDEFELYTNSRLVVAKERANRNYTRSVRIQYTPEEKGSMTILEFNLEQHIRSITKKRKNK